MNIALKRRYLFVAAFFFFFVVAFASADITNAAAIARADVVALTNADRAVNDAGMLAEDPLLDKAAQMKADDMAARGYFSHVSPEGLAPWYWFTLNGYYYTHAGENLAFGFADAAGIESAWMRSPSHRANLLKPIYTKIGVGIAQGNYQGRPVTFVVQFFATPVNVRSAPGNVLTKKISRVSAL